MSSSFTLDKVLANAKTLVTHLKDQEAGVDSLLSQTQDMGKKVEAMKMVSKSLLTYCVNFCEYMFTSFSVVSVFSKSSSSFSTTR